MKKHETRKKTQIKTNNVTNNKDKTATQYKEVKYLYEKKRKRKEEQSDSRNSYIKTNENVIRYFNNIGMGYVTELETDATEDDAQEQSKKRLKIIMFPVSCSLAPTNGSETIMIFNREEKDSKKRLKSGGLHSEESFNYMDRKTKATEEALLNKFEFKKEEEKTNIILDSCIPDDKFHQRNANNIFRNESKKNSVSGSELTVWSPTSSYSSDSHILSIYNENKKDALPNDTSSCPNIQNKNFMNTFGATVGKSPSKTKDFLKCLGISDSILPKIKTDKGDKDMKKQKTSSSDIKNSSETKSSSSVGGIKYKRVLSTIQDIDPCSVINKIARCLRYFMSDDDKDGKEASMGNGKSSSSKSGKGSAGNGKSSSSKSGKDSAGKPSDSKPGSQASSKDDCKKGVQINLTFQINLNLDGEAEVKTDNCQSSKEKPKEEKVLLLQNKPHVTFANGGANNNLDIKILVSEPIDVSSCDSDSIDTDTIFDRDSKALEIAYPPKSQSKNSILSKQISLTDTDKEKTMILTNYYYDDVAPLKYSKDKLDDRIKTSSSESKSSIDYSKILQEAIKKKVSNTDIMKLIYSMLTNENYNLKNINAKKISQVNYMNSNSSSTKDRVKKHVTTVLSVASVKNNKMFKNNDHFETKKLSKDEETECNLIKTSLKLNRNMDVYTQYSRNSSKFCKNILSEHPVFSVPMIPSEPLYHQRNTNYSLIHIPFIKSKTSELFLSNPDDTFYSDDVSAELSMETRFIKEIQSCKKIKAKNKLSPNILQCIEAKKAVLEIYGQSSDYLDNKIIVAKLPKFDNKIDIVSKRKHSRNNNFVLISIT